MDKDFVRYADEESGVYVLEFAPTVKMISLSKEHMLVPVPWQVYLCQPRKNKVQFFARTEPLSSLNNVVCYPHISNMYRDCQPCGGVPFGKNGEDDVEYSIRMINYIWASGFQGGFYLSAEYGGHGGHHCLPGSSRGSLLPKDVVTHMKGSPMYYPGGDNGWGNNSRTYYDWIETLTLDDILKWKWHEAGTLKSLLPVQPKGDLDQPVVATYVRHPYNQRAKWHRVVTGHEGPGLLVACRQGLDSVMADALAVSADEPEPAHLCKRCAVSRR
jgi:hypothetical protein